MNATKQAMIREAVATQIIMDKVNGESGAPASETRIEEINESGICLLVRLPPEYAPSRDQLAQIEHSIREVLGDSCRIPVLVVQHGMEVKVIGFQKSSAKYHVRFEYDGMVEDYGFQTHAEMTAFLAKRCPERAPKCSNPTPSSP